MRQHETNKVKTCINKVKYQSKIFMIIVTYCPLVFVH